MNFLKEKTSQRLICQNLRNITKLTLLQKSLGWRHLRAEMLKARLRQLLMENHTNKGES